eukprot:1289798-Rhodomonas_salina.2
MEGGGAISVLQVIAQMRRCSRHMYSPEALAKGLGSDALRDMMYDGWQLDLGDFDSVRKFAGDVKALVTRHKLKGIQALYNNAGLPQLVLLIVLSSWSGCCTARRRL